MAVNGIDTLKRLAREAELNVIEHDDGRITVLGGLAMVSWWPHSRRMSAYVDRAPNGVRHATAKMVIDLATKGQVK
jgi:hypothetical protein